MRIRYAGLALCLFTGLASSVYAQSNPYLGGVVFADVQRASGQSGPGSTGFVTKLDGTSIGGGIRGGVFLAPRVSLELGVDLGSTIERTVTPQFVPLEFATIIGGVTNAPPFAVFPAPRIEEHLTSRTTATSVLVAYHPTSRKHIRPGFLGGLSFMHTTMVETVQYTFAGQATATILPPIPGPTSTRIETLFNQVAATVGAEAAFELARQVAVIAEIRAHAFDNRFVIRPGLGARWSW